MQEADIKRYLRVLRTHRVLIVVTVVVCTALAAIYAWTREPTYSAHTQLFVSTRATPGASPSQIYEGGLASQSRAESYATLLTSTRVVEGVIASLGLSESVDDIRGEITATAPPETALIDVTVDDPSPERATDIANALADEFPRFVARLESSGPSSDESASPVDVSVTSPPQLPTSPTSPNKGLYLAGGILLGLILGIGGAVGRELLDRRVRDDEAAEAISGAPVIGRIPRDGGAGKRPLVVVADPDSPEAEAYRRLRTNLRALTIDRRQRSLLLTSAVAGEGKSLIAANLAVAFAQGGHHVALVDADLRRPGLHRLLDLDPRPGLSELLSEESGDGESIAARTDAILHREHRFPLEVLTAGSPPPNPSDLLDSDAFAEVMDTLTRRAEIVIVDSPALLAVGDAAVIARLVSAVLLVAHVSTRVEDLDLAAESLRRVGAQPVGAILNAAPHAAGAAYVYGPRKAAARSPRAPVWERQPTRR